MHIFCVAVSECGMCVEFEYGVLVVDDLNTAYMIKKVGEEETIIPDPSYDEQAAPNGNVYELSNLD